MLYIISKLIFFKPYSISHNIILIKLFIKTYGTLNSVNVNSNIVFTINNDIILQFTNQLLDKPYTQQYIDTALKYIYYKPDNTLNNTNNTLSKKQKFRLYQQQYRLLLSQDKKDKLTKNNALRNKHNYHNDTQYRLN